MATDNNFFKERKALLEGKPNKYYINNNFDQISF